MKEKGECESNIKYEVSVVVPCHNVEPWLDKCVDSILKQTLSNLEIILVENGSKDKTAEICKRYSRQYDNITHITSTPPDPSTARNFGISVAKGKYLAFVDGDDWIEPDTYQVMISEMERTGCKLGYFIYRYEWDDGRVKDQFEATGETEIQNVIELQKRVIPDKQALGACCMIFPREFFHKHKFPEMKYMEDYASLYWWIAECDEVVCVKRHFYHYVQHGKGVMASMKNTATRHLDFLEAEFGRFAYLLENNIYSSEQERMSVLNVILDKSLKHIQMTLNMDKSKEDCNRLEEIRKFILAKTQKLPLSSYPKGKQIHLLLMRYAWPVHCLFLKKIWRQEA